MKLRGSVRFACQHVRSDIKELKRKFPTFGLILHWQEANNLQKERKKSRFKKCKERRDLKEKSKQRTLLRVKSYLSDLNSHLSTRPISQPDWPSYFLDVTKLDDSPFQTDDTGNSFFYDPAGASGVPFVSSAVVGEMCFSFFLLRSYRFCRGR